MNFEKIIIMILTSVFINNIIFSRIIGLLEFFEETKKVRSAFSIGFSTTIIMTFSSMISWVVHKYVMLPYNLESLGILIHVVIIIAVGYLFNFIFKRYNLIKYSSISGIGIIANSAVLGVVLINMQGNLTFIENLISSFFLGIGYLLALLIVAGIHERLEETQAPEAFKGIPITMISMGIVAMIFMGFFGIKG